MRGVIRVNEGKGSREREAKRGEGNGRNEGW